LDQGVRWLIGTAIALASLIVTWLAFQYPKSPHTENPGAAGNPTVGKLVYEQLQAGDCLTGSELVSALSGQEAPWPQYVEAVPCNDPHVAEVYYVNESYWQQDESFPGDDVVNKEGKALCDSAFKSYIGAAADQSIYTSNSNNPSSASWAQGDRSVQCVAYYQAPGNPEVSMLNRSIHGAGN
jgi:Septum formation